MALGMRRLSIIDVVHGHQPFGNEDGSIQSVANGEIYNFEDLRRDLTARGHVLRTRSDIEVIPHSTRNSGRRSCTRLHGMFAFASVGRADAHADGRARPRRREAAVLRRNGGWAGPRIRDQGAAAGARSREGSRLVSLDQFLTYEYVISPRTIFSGIRACRRRTTSSIAMDD
jgi:asparagine synthase (glutamine-hydrolysing)